MACLWGGVDSWPSAAHCKSYRFFGIACRLGRMVGTSRRPRVDGSVIAHRILTAIIFQGWARRPTSLTLARLFAIRRKDWLARRRRHVNMADRLDCLEELGSIGRPASSAPRCFQRDMIDSDRRGTQTYGTQNGC